MHPDSGSGGGTSTTVADGFGRGVTFLTTFALVAFFLFAAGEVFTDLDLLVDAAGLLGVIGLWANGFTGFGVILGVDGLAVLSKSHL